SKKLDRNIYLSNTDIEDAVPTYLKKIAPSIHQVAIETVDIRQANGRVTAAPIFARLSSPNHNAAAMDGIMVIAERTYTANEATPVILTRGVDFEYINTGHLILEPYDSVIMIEDLVPVSSEFGADGQANQVKIMVQASPWQHIRPIGEDVVAGEMILPENHKIRPMDLGAVLSSGITQIQVYEKIRVGILPTGNEITDAYEQLETGKTFDTNSWTFKAIVEDLGGIANRVSPVEDDYDKLKEAILKLTADNHVVIINAGSSAGSKDYTVHLIEELGQVVLHGIAIKPGKPTILGEIDGKPVMGVPGYPGSAFLVFEEIVGPVIKALQRQPLAENEKAMAVVSRRMVSSLKYREYIRVKLGLVDEKLIATPLNRGAGVNMALVKADGLMIIQKNSEGYEAGESVPVELFTPLDVIKNTIVSIGSHDLIIDFIDNILMKRHENAGSVAARLSSAHVGSMGGIMALKRGETHMAPIHLLDEETGEYNQAYLNKYLAGEKITLVKGVKRQQGFILPKGNPKNIQSIEDLTKPGMTFANRQKGSGTRVLTDYLIKKAGMDSDAIMGYNREMTTHMAVAAAVKSGSADVGIGVYSAAKTMDLDFVFIGNEDYDFAIPQRYLDMPSIAAFIQVLDSPEFLQVLKDLGG
ncbi:MAG: molybdopterin biosynthesis protein, partial [Anaerovorax sp.]